MCGRVLCRESRLKYHGQMSFEGSGRAELTISGHGFLDLRVSVIEWTLSTMLINFCRSKLEESMPLAIIGNSVEDWHDTSKWVLIHESEI